MSDYAKSIYVQIDLSGDIDRLWQLTQTPNLHQQWDLRFSDIKYLPRPDTELPQQFLYSTRIGFGLKIFGKGESVGSRDLENGERTSALKFWSDDQKSLIREGSGYWKYIPSGDAGKSIRFITVYDYSVRFGMVGRLFDRLVFRPLIGWATAWSFDRLRLWIEKGTNPATAMRQSLVHLTARLTVAFVWLYHGLVPKLIFQHPDEVAMLRAGGLSGTAAHSFCSAVGWIEVIVGLMLFVAWRSRLLLWFTLIVMPLALLGVAIKAPHALVAPFNPVTLNLCVFMLAAIALLTARDLPSATKCVRRPPRVKP